MEFFRKEMYITHTLTHSLFHSTPLPIPISTEWLYSPLSSHYLILKENNNKNPGSYNKIIEKRKGKKKERKEEATNENTLQIS